MLDSIPAYLGLLSGRTRRVAAVYVKKQILAGLLACMLLLSVFMPALPGAAQIYDPDVDLPRPTGFEMSLTKLGRGLSNILYGWAEIPVTFDRKLKEGKPFAYLFGVVPVLGTARALMRTGTGVFEVFTFPFTDRDVAYRAVLEPEYIF
jgi:putative exosortase-associated protein (TIGR04073 family)